MAIIQTIRDKYAKLAGAVVVIALVGFVIGGTDFTNMFGSGSTIAKINGNSLDYTDYQTVENNVLEQYKRQNGGSIDDVTTAQARQQAWGLMIQESILGNIYDKLGMEVSQKELNDLLYGDYIDQEILRQVPKDPNTGAIDRDALAQNIAATKNNPDQKAQWMLFEQDIISRRMREKFNTMAAASIYTPSFIIEASRKEASQYANAQLVNIPFSSIPDNDIKNTDEELLEYMKKHPKMFTPKQNLRSIEYVSFAIVPNSEDTAKALNAINEITAEFQNTSDKEQLADLVNLNSDVNMAPNYFTKEQMKELPQIEELWNAPNNTVVGPVLDNGTYTISKIVDKRTLPDSTIFRRLLVVVKSDGQDRRTDAEAKARIDSAVAALQQGMPFDSVAINFSDDLNILQQGGVYTVRPQNIDMMLDPAESDFLFSAATGASKLMKFENDQITAYEYAEVMNQGATNTYAKVAIIGKSLDESNEAFEKAYADASKFLSNATDAKSFDAEAQKAGITITPIGNIVENSELLQGLGSSRDLTKWIYSAQVGDVSKTTFSVGNQYVVAKLTGIQEKGKIELTDLVRQDADILLKNEKKAKMIIDKNNSATSLEAIASQNGQTVITADSVNLAGGYIPGVGNEARAVGYIFSKAAGNKVSKGIPGSAGVVYLKVNEKYTIPAPSTGDINMEKRMYNMQYQSNASNMYLNGLIENADIDDKRSELFR